DKTLFFTDLPKMLDEIKPDAVSAFGAINEHIAVVRACAPRQIHVMVEKPLATTVADAKEIKELAERYKIHVLTNFETSWYESNSRRRSIGRNTKSDRERRASGTKRNRSKQRILGDTNRSGKEWSGCIGGFRVLWSQPDDLVDERRETSFSNGRYTSK